MQISAITFHFSLQLKIHVRTKIYSRNVSGTNELARVFQFLSTKTGGRNARATVQCYSNIFRESKKNPKKNVKNCQMSEGYKPLTICAQSPHQRCFGRVLNIGNEDCELAVITMCQRKRCVMCQLALTINGLVYGFNSKWL